MASEATEKLRQFVEEAVENAQNPRWIKKKKYKERLKKQKKEVEKRYGLS